MRKQNICQPQLDKYIFIYDHLTVVRLLFHRFKKTGGVPWKFANILYCFVLN